MKATFQIVPLYTHKGVTCTKLLTPDGHIVRLHEQWIARSEDRKIWAKYVSQIGETWWLDYDEVSEMEKTAKGKRKPFLVEIEVIEPPPPEAICGSRFEY